MINRRIRTIQTQYESERFGNVGGKVAPEIIVKKDNAKNRKNDPHGFVNIHEYQIDQCNTMQNSKFNIIISKNKICPTRHEESKRT